MTHPENEEHSSRTITSEGNHQGNAYSLHWCSAFGTINLSADFNVQILPFKDISVLAVCVGLT